MAGNGGTGGKQVRRPLRAELRGRRAVRAGYAGGAVPALADSEARSRQPPRRREHTGKIENQFPTKLILAVSLTDFPVESVTVSRNM
jgi:hypothetical protein